MPEEVTDITTKATKTASDGFVKIAIEKYNDLVETVASQKGSITSLTEQLSRARSMPPVINQTIVEKTPEMLAKEHKAWGGTLMGLGASMFVVGVIRLKASVPKA